MAIEKGTIKVVWLPKNSKKICSMMFDDIDAAIKFGNKKKDYIVFKLIKHKDFKLFEWEILPYGRYKEYLALVQNYNKHKNKFDFLIKDFLRFANK